MWLHVLLLTNLLLNLHPLDADGHGTLTLVVRDAVGHTLPGVEVRVYRDTDSGQPALIVRQTTDAKGQLMLPDLQWGIYIVQFAGTLPDGRPVQPIAEQNARAVTDVGLGTNGFGIRLSQERMLQPFVMAGTEATAPARPMFDLAASVDEAPRPVEPITGQEIPAAVAARDDQPATVDGDVVTRPADPKASSSGNTRAPTGSRMTRTSRLWLTLAGAVDLLLLAAWLVAGRRHRASGETR